MISALPSVISMQICYENGLVDGEEMVNYCRLDMDNGSCFWWNWTERHTWDGNAGDLEVSDIYDRDCKTLGMLLDLNIGTLSVYQNGRKPGYLKDGLAGEYCWIVGFGSVGGNVSIRRGYNLNVV